MSILWSLGKQSLKCITPVPKDIFISQNQIPRNIKYIAEEIGILEDELELYGKYKAKVSNKIYTRLSNSNTNTNGKYILVTGITPTPLGEGKSTTVIGLAQSLFSRCNRNSFACIRQPSQGPTFGIKGGAAGGGYSQVIPMEEFNLHLTGDIHAITAANNLIAAAIDTRIFHENTQKDEALFNRLIRDNKFNAIQLKRLKNLGIMETDPQKFYLKEKRQFARLNINPNEIMLNRVIDTNDRFLRKITIGQSPTEKNFTRETQFDISVSSELMAIIALSNNIKDMISRIERMVVAKNKDNMPITCLDLGVSGAVAVLLKDTMMPTLMQTLEGSPVFVHAGPFANIAHGNSSIIADKMALKIVGPTGYIITEAGFGADIGMEKFCNIKCRESGLQPDLAVIVATIRALKMHGGGPNVIVGKPLAEEYSHEDLVLLEKGLPNLVKHLENIKLFNLKVVVALNVFSSDTKAEIELVKTEIKKLTGVDTIESTHWEEGGKGAEKLAEKVISMCEEDKDDKNDKNDNDFRFSYELDLPIKYKIEKIATEIYGALNVSYSEKAEEQIKWFTEHNYTHLTICMAKTHLSFSSDKNLKGRPRNFTIPIGEVKGSIGAGFLYPLVGDLSKMPGLPTRPCFYDIYLDPDTEKIVGLF